MARNGDHSRVRELFAYMYIMVAGVFALAAIVVLSLYSMQDVELDIRDRVTFYHLNSSAIAQELRQEVRQLEHTVFAHQHDDSDDDHVREMHATVDQQVLLASIDINVGRLAELQARYAGPEFVETLRRVQSRAQQLAGFAGQQPTADEADVFARSFENTVLQLARLHMVAAEKALARLEDSSSRTKPFYVALLAFAGTTVLIVAFTMRLVRSSIAREDEARDALAQSREQLHHMQKLDALGQLVGGVAHDFNNLLTAILGQTAQLLKHTESDRSRKSLEQIQKASNQAADLTRQLLAFSRMQPVEPRVFDINELLKDMDGMLKRMIGENIALDMQLGAGLPGVEMDPTQLRQVILNLASNARDAMPRGGSLKICTTSRDLDPTVVPGLEAGQYVEISVVDSGIGMTKETRERIFEPFFTTKPMGRGTGLGLSTVHGIVKAAGGIIEARSRIGEGAQFTVLLPASTKKTDSLSERSADKPSSRGSETVLIVEDEELIRAMLKEGLRQYGYTVLTATNADEGLDYCAGEHGDIDVLISDVIMPKVNGAEFLDEARRLQPAAVCILMSGYTDTVLEDSGLELGNIPLLQKPFEIDKLAQLVREQLDERAGDDRA